MTGAFNAGVTPTITCQVKKGGVFVTLPTGETVPTNAGQYKASTLKWAMPPLR